MALPPTIPTSFVPHTSAAAERRYKVDFIGVFGFISYAIFVVSLVLAVGVFLYGQMLSSQLASKNAALADQEKKISSAVAESLVQLDSRLTEGQVLLDKHVALSNFFQTLNRILPTTVRFSSLQINTGDGSQVILSGSGVAKTFNALAAASASFATDGQIKSAIFSKLTVNKDNSVSFALNAIIDPGLVKFKAGSTPEPLPPEPVEQESATTTTP